MRWDLSLPVRDLPYEGTDMSESQMTKSVRQIFRQSTWWSARRRHCASQPISDRGPEHEQAGRPAARGAGPLGRPVGHRPVACLPQFFLGGAVLRSLVGRLRVDRIGATTGGARVAVQAGIITYSLRSGAADIRYGGTQSVL